MIDRDHLIPAIMGLLGEIVEPCSVTMRNPMSIVEMGLIDDVVMDDGGEVTITMCLTDPGCVHFGGMQAFIADKLRPLPGVTRVNVRQTLDKRWTDDRVKQNAA